MLGDPVLPNRLSSASQLDLGGTLLRPEPAGERRLAWPVDLAALLLLSSPAPLNFLEVVLG